MNTSHKVSVPTPASRYWGMLKGLSNKEKLDLIVMLNASIAPEEPTEEDSSEWTSRYVGVWKDESDRKLDEALALFHKEWGGDRNPIEIANELRQNVDTRNDVEVWQ